MLPLGDLRRYVYLDPETEAAILWEWRRDRPGPIRKRRAEDILRDLDEHGREREGGEDGSK